MENNTIDARGLSCPQPLIMAVDALKKYPSFTILVDNEVSKENIIRVMKDKYGIEVQLKNDGEEYALAIAK